MGNEGTWWLANGEAQRAATPWSFHMPPRWRRQRLRPGRFAKVIFNFPLRHHESWGEVDGERMWVKVTERRSGSYTGTLASVPEVLTDLSFGDVIEFAPENVIAISARSRP